jgi:3-oxoacyl-[acyl-carrier-protein] synthase-3
MPNTASRVQKLLGARNAGAMDVNTACTSFMYGLSVGSALIRSGAVRNAVVIGADALSQFMDWNNRGPAILFGDGAGAVVLESTDTDAGIVGEVLGCDTADREMLRINGIGAMFANMGVCYGNRRGFQRAGNLPVRRSTALLRLPARYSRRSNFNQGY